MPKMMFHDLDEFANYIPVNVSFSLERMAKTIKLVQWEYIRPLLGKELYEQLEADFEAGNQDATHLILLERVQYAVASLAFHEYLPYAQVQINEEGIQIITSENAKAAFRWQVEKLADSSLFSGYRFLEQLLSFLEDHREDYAAWIHADRSTFLVHSATEFNQEVFINSSRLIYLKLLPSMKRVQRRIRARISSAVFDLIRQGAAADSLEGKDIQLAEYLKECIANLAFSDAVRALPITFEGGRMSIYSNEFLADFKPGVQPEQETLALLARKHSEAGEKALRKAIKYIENNIEDFPGYQDSGHYTLPELKVSRDIEDSGFLFL